MNPLLLDRFPRDVHTDPHDPKNESHRMARELRDRRHSDSVARACDACWDCSRPIGYIVRSVDGKLRPIARLRYYAHHDHICFVYAQNLY